MKDKDNKKIIMNTEMKEKHGKSIKRLVLFIVIIIVITVVLFLLVSKNVKSTNGSEQKQAKPPFLDKYKPYFDAFWSSGKDPPVSQKQWYEVDGWEIEYCSKFGGLQSPVNSGEVIASQISQLTATLQASRKKQPDNTTLYEVSYYIQPIKDSVPYVVEVLGNGTNRTVDKGTAYPSGIADYAAFYDDANYDRARVIYGGRVLIVELPDYDNLALAQKLMKNITTNATNATAPASQLSCGQHGGAICRVKACGEPAKDLCIERCNGAVVESRDGGVLPYARCCVGVCNENELVPIT